MSSTRTATGISARSLITACRALARRVRADGRGRIRLHELHKDADGARLGREIGAFRTLEELVDFLGQGPRGVSQNVAVQIAVPFGLRGLTSREEADLLRRCEAHSRARS
jgi:hypothetical protein